MVTSSKQNIPSDAEAIESIETVEKYPCQATRTDIAKDGCLGITKMPARNANFCQGCGSPWRRCWFCLVQAYTDDDAQVSNLVTGLCLFHEKNGRDTVRPKQYEKIPFEHSGFRSVATTVFGNAPTEHLEKSAGKGLEKEREIDGSLQEADRVYDIVDHHDKNDLADEDPVEPEREPEPEVEVDATPAVDENNSQPEPIKPETVATAPIKKTRTRVRKPRSAPKPSPQELPEPPAEEALHIAEALEVVKVVMPTKVPKDTFVHGVSLAKTAALYTLLRPVHVELIRLMAANKSKKEICDELKVTPIYFASLSSAARALLAIPELSLNKTENTKFRNEVLRASYLFLQKREIGNTSN